MNVCIEPQGQKGEEEKGKGLGLKGLSQLIYLLVGCLIPYSVVRILSKKSPIYKNSQTFQVSITYFRSAGYFALFDMINYYPESLRGRVKSFENDFTLPIEFFATRYLVSTI